MTFLILGTEMAVGKGSDPRVGLVAPWGRPDTPLLPWAIRGALVTEPLPGWIRRELGLFPTATFGALGRKAVRTRRCPGRVLSFILNQVRERMKEIAPLRAIPWNWPKNLDQNSVPWKIRTRNCLLNAGVLRRGEACPLLPEITFGELLAVRGMGLVSVLDFSCVAEAAIEEIADPAELVVVQAGSTSVGVDLNCLVEIIDSPWATQVSSQDPRFRDLVPVSGGDLTVLEQIDVLTGQPQEDTTGLSALAEAVPALQVRVRELSELTLDAALRELLILLSGVADHRLEALLARLGWLGRPPVTLAEAGQIADLTRERVRQIEKRVLGRVPDHPVFMPSLNAALELVADNAPLDIQDAADLLKEAGISSKPFDPRSLLVAAKVCGHGPTFELETIRGQTRVVISRLGRRAGKIISIGHRQAEASGASNVQEVMAEVLATGIESDEEEVRDILESFSTAEFLDKDWFWRPDGKMARNRLRNISIKMLSITAALEVGVIDANTNSEPLAG